VSEFSLIARHFARPLRHPANTPLGIGDDAALLQPSAGEQLVVTTDMLVEGTHFLADTDAKTLGWKTLAVNLSDLAAMGATPRWLLLAGALPDADPAWLSAFATGAHACAEAFEADLVGGDTTRGPRCFCVTAIGEVPAGQALRRSGGQPGDDLWVSGQPGRAALGLAHVRGQITLSNADARACADALHQPQPRVALGIALRSIAHAAIDVSDGLIADLGHILRQSGLAAEVGAYLLPSPAADVPLEKARTAVLAGGDDYELLFSAPPAAREAIALIGHRLALPLTRFGALVPGPGGQCTVRDVHGAPLPLERVGYDHFPDA
jgi:thiamine-monophosphate kinase